MANLGVVTNDSRMNDAPNPRGSAEPPTPPERAEPTRISSPSELVSLIPYLLGFHPTASVVIMAFENARLGLTARVGLELCARPELLGSRLAAIEQQFPDAGYVLAGYADDRAAADKALSTVEYLLGTENIIDSFYVTSDRYWSRFCSQPGCCPPEGRVYDTQISAAAARAVLAGLQAAPTRSDLARRVQSPRGGAARLARRVMDAAHDTQRNCSDEELIPLVDALLTQGLACAAELSAEQIAQLSVSMDRPLLRDRALRRLSRGTALAHVALWERMVRSTPRAEQGPALGLLGLAAWVSGDGALQVICLERAEQSRIWHPLLEILHDINRMAAPATLWDRLRSELFDAATSVDQAAKETPNT